MRLNRSAGAILAASGVAGALWLTCPAQAGQSPALGVQVASQVLPTKPASAVAKPAPTTAAGYWEMFSTVDQDEWASADVSLSVPLHDGRVVWLYGDTFTTSSRPMVHSSAIIQTGGDLHVSRGGAQVLPNDRNGDFYWIEAGRPYTRGTSLITITAMPIRKTGPGMWDFERSNPLSRVALVNVTKSNDLTFVKWMRWTTAPATFNDFTVVEEPYHFQYENRAHPWAKLSSGQTLWTVNNGWGGPDFKRLPSGYIDYSAYRPSFYESTKTHDHTQK